MNIPSPLTRQQYSIYKQYTRLVSHTIHQFISLKLYFFFLLFSHLKAHLLTKKKLFISTVQN